MAAHWLRTFGLTGMKLGYVMVVLLCLTVAGLATIVTYQVNRRRFLRRNFAGVEGFESYGQSVAIRAVEKTVMLVARPIRWLAIGLAFTTLFMLIHS